MLGWVGALALGYLIGTIPFGFLAGKWRGVDVRQYGSGSTGATNVMRTLGTRLALLVFLADLSKGVGAALLGWVLTGSPAGAVVAGLLAIAGHNWPFYLGFRGGRGVIVLMGAFFVVDWRVALASTLFGFLVIALFRYVSLGSLLGVTLSMALSLVVVLTGGSGAPLVLALAGGGLVVFQHRENIARLLRGTERRLGRAAERRQ